jgi:hypothetical protein
MVDGGSITSKPLLVSARLFGVGLPPGRARRRRVQTSGCTTIGKDLVPHRPANPARPPAWSKWPCAEHYCVTSDLSMPGRSALVIMVSGERPVSNRTQVVVLPVRTLTSAERPWLGHQTDLGGSGLQLQRLRDSGCEGSTGNPLLSA